MNMNPDVFMFASRRLLKLLYIEQLSRARVSPYNPPADTTDVPIIVLVGYEAVGKGSLCRRIAAECSSHVELAMKHTTAFYHSPGHYKQITRKQFDDMLLNGEFLTYSEMDGESYGVSREEVFVKDGKVRVVTMDLLGALMLKLRGRQPYLILTTCTDKRALATRQLERKAARDLANEEKLSTTMEISTLQVLLSGRIIINGILNEILQAISEDKSQSEFIMDSECSLLLESESRQPRKYNKNANRLTLLTPSSSSLGDVCKNDQDKTSSQVDSSMYSLYKESQPMDEFTSDVYGLASSAERGKGRRNNNHSRHGRFSIRPKSFDTVKQHTNWKAGSRKSSKSVAFISPENTDIATDESDPSGMYIEPVPQKEMENVLLEKSISIKVGRTRGGNESQESDLWFAFLIENGLAQASEIFTETYNLTKHESRLDDADFFRIQMDIYKEIPTETFTTTLKDDYDEIHRTSPGLFWDTVDMDNAEAAFIKIKRIIRDIVNSQIHLKPLFDVDFTNLNNYPNMKEKLAKICSQIAPQRLFY